MGGESISSAAMLRWGGNNQRLDLLSGAEELRGLATEQRALASMLAQTRVIGPAMRPGVSFFPENPARGAARTQTKQGRAGRIAGNVLFYAALAAIVITALCYRVGGGRGSRNLGGYSIFNVLTESMESVIPRGSLVVTRYTDPYEIKVNDDITFLISEKTSVTHRVVEIIEDFMETEQRGFLTQGVDNDAPDRDPVYAQNVVGKVVWHAPLLGTVLTAISEYWLAVVLPLAGICAVFWLLKHAARKKSVRN